MAELTTLARPYARAAFEFARDINALDRWSNMLATTTAVVQNADAAKLLKSPNYTGVVKGQKVVDICGDEIDNKVGNFVKHLAKNNRLELLPEVRELFEQMKANHEKTVDVNIATAFEISAEQQSKLAISLEKKLNRKINLQTSTDAGLLGGAVIRAGDTVIDGSIRGRLAKLAESMGV